MEAKKPKDNNKSDIGKIYGTMIYDAPELYEKNKVYFSTYYIQSIKINFNDQIKNLDSDAKKKFYDKILKEIHRVYEILIDDPSINKNTRNGINEITRDIEDELKTLI